MKKYYYFSLSFVDNTGHIVSTIVKSERKEITEPLIRDARNITGMTEAAALLVASPLGKMSDTFFSTGYQKRFPWIQFAGAIVAMAIGGVVVYLMTH